MKGGDKYICVKKKRTTCEGKNRDSREVQKEREHGDIQEGWKTHIKKYTHNKRQKEKGI